MPIIHKARNPDLWVPDRVPVRPTILNREHPLMRGLQGHWFFDRPDPRNAVTGKPPTTVSSGVTMDVSPLGRCARTNSGGYWELGTCADVYSASTTFGYVRYGWTFPSASRAGFGNMSATDTGSCYLPFSDNNIYFDFPDSGAGRVSVSMPVPNRSAGQVETWLFRAGSGGRAIWLNGTALLSVGTPTTTATPSAAQNFGLNSNAQVGSGFANANDMGVHLFATWSRELSDGEMKLWSDDPFCLLRPEG